MIKEDEKLSELKKKIENNYKDYCQCVENYNNALIEHSKGKEKYKNLELKQKEKKDVDHLNQHCIVLDKYLNDQLSAFEVNYKKWNYNEILLWLKCKLNFQDCKNSSNKFDFDTVESNLKSQEMIGEYLPDLAKSDIRGLGFEAFKDQLKVYKMIQELIKKVSKVNSGATQTQGEGDDAGQVEGQVYVE